MAETKETKATETATETKATTTATQSNKQSFINRKLQVLNNKSGAKYERIAARVVENNK